MDGSASGVSDIGFGGWAYRTVFEKFESSPGFFLASHPQGTIATGFDIGWDQSRLADAEIGVLSCVSSLAVTSELYPRDICLRRVKCLHGVRCFHT